MKAQVWRRLLNYLRTIPRPTWAFLFALLLAIVAAAPLFSGPGLLNTRGGGDSPFLLQRLHQLEQALQEGHFPVRWMADANYGYGYPFFHYYAPLSIYIAFLFRVLGADYVLAIQLAQLSGFLVAAAAAFILGYRWYRSAAAGLLAATAYTLAPFHMVNVYVRGDSLAEFWAMALYPLVLLAADAVIRTRGRGRWPALSGLALAYAALILSHNISALIFSPFLLLYLLLRLAAEEEGRRRPALFAAGAGLLWGLALSAWFWFPALAETDLVQTEPVTAGYFHFANHFRSADLAQTTLLFDYDVAGGNAFRMGLVQLLLIGGGLFALIAGLWNLRRQRDGLSPTKTTGSLPAPVALFLLLALIVATLMITPLSRPLWQHLPLLPFTQFPWRFLSVQALVGALVAAALAAWLPRPRRWLPSLLALLLLAGMLWLDPVHLPLAEGDVTTERLAVYEWFTGNIGTTVSAEYLPQGVRPRPYSSRWLTTGERDRPSVLQGHAEATLLRRHATHQEWLVSTGGEGATLLLPTLFWPGWRVTLDGTALPLVAAPGSGLITATLPAGEHKLTLRLGRTPLRAGAEMISLCALLPLLALAWRERRALIRPLLVGGAGTLVLAAGLALLPTPKLDSGTLTWDFAQAGYLHHAPQGIQFEDGSHLARYDYSDDVVTAGDTWQLTLEWTETGAASNSTMVSLVTPAVNRFEAAPALALTTVQPGVASQEIALSIPGDAPPGLYLPRLEREGSAALLANGEKRGPIFLRPLRIVAATDEAAPPPTARAARAASGTVTGPAPRVSGTNRDLFDCAAGEATATALRLPLAWYTAQPLSANLTASLRLVDSQGLEVAQCDVQPGYGFLPSTSWPEHRWLNDLLALPLPSQLPAAAPYTVAVHLYDGNGQTWLTRRLGELHWQEMELVFKPTQPSFELPVVTIRAEASFGQVARLRGYDQEQEDNAITLTFYWQALEPEGRDYVRFVQLLDANGQIVRRNDDSTVQIDSMPRHNVYPTSQWTSGEIVADTVRLSLEGVASGNYHLALGFYPPETPGARLPLANVRNGTAADNVLLLPLTVD